MHVPLLSPLFVHKQTDSRWPPADVSDSSSHTLRMPAVGNGDCAGRFAAELEVMTYNAINLALSQLSSAERCAISRDSSLDAVKCLCRPLDKTAVQQGTLGIQGRRDRPLCRCGSHGA